MKYVLILALLAFVVGLVYWRLRPYIRMARRFLTVVRDVRRVSEANTPGDVQRRESRPRASNEMLVRCASCGVYVSSTKATSCGRPDCPYR